MKVDLLPGFAPADSFVVSNRQTSTFVKGCGVSTPLASTARVTSNPALYDRRFDDFAARVRRFAGSLSREHRAAVAARVRFRFAPWLRRADEPDLNDYLPQSPIPMP